jgi:integrase
MLVSVKPVCKKSLMRRDGTSVIFLQYCHTGEKRTLLNSGIAIPPTFWNLKRLRISADLPESYGKAEDLNGQLQQSIRVVEDILAFAAKKKLPDPLKFLKNTFKPGLDVSRLDQKAEEIDAGKLNLDLFHQIDDYIVSKTRHVTPKMLHVFRNMKETLKAFESYRKRPITFESFDFNFYEEFVEYMMYEHIHRRRKGVIKGFRTSTIGRTIKQIRIFLRNRMRRKIISPINLDDFKIIDEEADAVYLTWDEIKRIYQVDLSAYPHLSQYRGLFVFGCLTGLRFSDFSTIQSEDVRNGMLYKKQDKSDRWVVVPLRDEALSIFVDQFNRTMPVVCNGVFNRRIKEIAKLAGILQPIKFSHKRGVKDVVIVKPKYEWITSHTCRRSFCTNEFLAGTPVDLIMKISGHKSLRDFYKYIRITPEEAGIKIKQIWENRGDMNMGSKAGTNNFGEPDRLAV